MISENRHGRLLRSATAGFLAGGLSLLVLLAVVEALFFLAGFMSMLGELAKLRGLGLDDRYPLTPHLLFLGLLDAGATAAGHIWAARMGFLPLGAMGAVAATTQTLAGRLGQRRSHRLGLLAVVAMTNVLVLIWELGRRQRISVLLTQNPQYFAWQEILLESLPTTLMAGMALAFLAAYLLWEIWHWCYHQLGSFLRMGEPAPDVRHAGSRSWLLASGAALGCCIFSLVPALRFYEREGPATISGQAWLDADTPRTAIPLNLEKRPERLAVSNVQGLGQVEIYISEVAQQGPPLRGGKKLRLTDDIHQYAYSEISLVDLPPATYYLHLAISGQDARGLIRYIALERGTDLTGLAAGTLTSLLTGALVSALILIIEAHDLAAAL
jgi:hypothetical protein